MKEAIFLVDVTILLPWMHFSAVDFVGYFGAQLILQLKMHLSLTKSKLCKLFNSSPPLSYQVWIIN